MKIAFYKVIKPGIQGWFNRTVRWWTSSIYSHCEAIFDDDLTIPVLCASASFLDHGVRRKMILLDPDHWDVLDVHLIDKVKVRTWFDAHLGQPYDVIGLLSVFTPVKDDKNKWFCSEALAAAAGFPSACRVDPGRFYDICAFLNASSLASFLVGVDVGLEP